MASPGRSAAIAEVGVLRMGERGRDVWLVGLGALLSGATSAAVLAVDGQDQIGGAFAKEQPTIYGPAQITLAFALAAAGLLLLVARKRVAVTALLGVIGLCAAQLAGAGLVARRRWPAYWGCCSFEGGTVSDLVRTLATTMAVVCALTAVACVVVLARRRDVRWTGIDLPVVAGFAAALVVVIAGPRLVEGSWGDGRELAAWALMYSLPFAAGLAISALMQRFAALAVIGAVAASALIATVGKSFLESYQQWGDAQILVILASVAVAATRLIPRDKSASAFAPTSSH